MVRVHIHQHMQGQLHAHQGLLEDHPAAGRAELPREEGPEGGQGLGLVLGQHHALAGRQAVGLEHDGVAVGPGPDEGLAFRQVHHRPAGGAGNAVADHEVLGEGLAPLQPGRGGLVAEDRHPRGPHRIGHARHQGRLGAHHHQVGAVGGAPARHDRRILRVQGEARAQFGQAVAAGDRDQLHGRGRSLELQGHRIFPAAGAEEQNLHGDLRGLQYRKGSPGGPGVPAVPGSPFHSPPGGR
jgi:hypothetical protein